MAFHLESGEPVGAGLQRLIRERLDDAVQALEDPQRDPGEAIHCARKQIKKLRAILRLVRSGIGERVYRRENDALRDIARSIGAARDAAVMLETFDTLLEKADDKPSRRAVAPIRRRLVQRRDAAQPGRGDTPRERFGDLVRGLRGFGERVERWPEEQLGLDAVARGLLRSYRRGRDAMRAAYRDPDPERFHDWRKRVKDLWYHTRILSEAWPEMLKAYRDGLKQLADLLGEDHDLAVLRETIAAMPADGVAEAAVDHVARIAGDRRAKLTGRARPIGERIYADRPRAFVERIVRLWERGAAAVAND